MRAEREFTRRTRTLAARVDRFIASLATAPMSGEPLGGAWEGYRAEHVYRDRYRVIWSVGDDVVEVFRVGLRIPPGSSSIYADPPPGEEDDDLPSVEGTVGEPPPSDAG